MRIYLHAGIAALALGLAACNNGGGNEQVNADQTGADNASSATTNGGNAENGTAGPAPGAGSIPCAFDNGRSRNWRAWIDAMPGPGPRPTLIVTAEVEAQAGYSGRLTPTHSDRALPPTQHFELTLVEQAGAPAGWREIRGQIRPSQGAYRAVVIDCGGSEHHDIAPVPIVE